ncbi:SEN1 N terminal-domain-containing protein [Bombardia bombarda]|uniref:SEN1 N terminal-domain-containing protein n=1 Tax=Bombardia bombarda TaxID=252184 RepID=A0AA39WI48_9PEZI|nr:SEN1 N terminal-domain-containing protein [Bombardia bombarda]
MNNADSFQRQLVERYQGLKSLDPKIHLFCPKLSDSDITNYDAPKVDDDDESGGVSAAEKEKRIEEGIKRNGVAVALSLLMWINEEDANKWLAEWKEAVEKFLMKCDGCALSWHKEASDHMEKLLNQFDKVRIDEGLKKAKTILEQHGPMTSSRLVSFDATAVLALFEALCCEPYLAMHENRDDFNYVFEKTQQKKPLKMQGGMIPTMTVFLFHDDKYRNKFARTHWERKTAGSLTADEWDWAVEHQLADRIVEVSMTRNMGVVAKPEKILRFWQSFLLILPSLSEHRIQDSLRAMEVTPSVYMLALEHMGTNSNLALAEVLKGQMGLMEKSLKSFWAAYDQVTPSQLVEEIIKSPALGSLLNTSLTSELMIQEGDHEVPILAAWARAFIRSLDLTRRSDACEALLGYLFDNFGANPQLTPEARTTCILTGLITLAESLDGFLESGKFNSGTSLIIVNQLLNRVVHYKSVIIEAADMKSGDPYNHGRSQAATSIIHSALELDAKATWTEWDALTKNVAVQDHVNRDSGALWEGFLELLWVGRVDLAKAMLLATMPLRSIEQFIPKRKETLRKEQEKFNRRYQQQTTAIGKVLGRLSDFNPADLDMFCSEEQSKTIHPIVASLIHGEDTIREAGFELIKAITGESQRSEAVYKMLEAYFSQFLDAFSGAVSNITYEQDINSPWSHMIPTQKCSEFVLNGLSDPSVGQLRSKTLTRAERGAVKRWWEVEWRLIGHSFKMLRHWHVRVDKKIMEDFCRDTMELAEKFLAQDGVIVSALCNGGGMQTSGDSMAEAMKGILEPPRMNSFSLTDMLQLRDKYLIQGIIGIIKKLLGRLKDNDMELPRNSIAALNNMLKGRRGQDGRLDYTTKTNLSNEQRIELLKALGEDAEIEEQFMGNKPGEKDAREKERVKKQSKLNFSKASVKDHISQITPSFEKDGLRRMLALESSEPTRSLKPTISKPDPKTVLAKQTSLKEARAKEKAEKAKRDAEAIARAKALRAPAKLVPGEGSGLQGIAGVRGKDHAPAAKDEMMVGSSSEEEDDSEDEMITRHVKAGRMTMDEAERRPILEWDIFHDSNDPPNGFRCDNVSDNYADPKSYKKTFFPLLINEAWRSFVTAKDEATSKPFGIKILNRMTVDKFLEVAASVDAPTSKDRGLSEGDIVIISRGEDPLKDQGEIHCLARIAKTTFKKNIVEVIYRLNAKGHQIMQVLIPGSEFNVVKITNMTTIEREYAALESLQYYDLMDEVLKAEPSPMLNFGDEAVASVMKNYQLNNGQARAILNAKENDGFTLVQGPPGTGKTKTIVAMVGSLLTGVLKTATAAVPINRPGATSANAAPTKKLLVCAPSNAAVDELVLRLKSGVRTMNGTFHKINVLRLGRSDAINAAVRDVTLDELVKAKVDAQLSSSAPSDREKAHQEAGEIKVKINELRPQLEAARESGDRSFAMKLQRDFDELKHRKAHVEAIIDNNKNNGNTFQREAEIKRRQIQQEILDQAQVLCATLSGAGHEMFKSLNVEFETVIIDEAAQCVELSALIPLKYGCQKCILVGDPKQLPPTVLSQSAAKYGYAQSLFVRMQKNHAKDVHLLDQQYRMHPEISQFPSREFYEGLLRDGDDMARLRVQPWHQSELLGPYRFFDVKGSQERGPRNQSLVNDEELKVAMQLYRRFRTDYNGLDLKGKIGIITPYKAQLFRLRQRFADAYGEGIKDEIEFNTTDAFQGRECEIIIFSCVRASPTGGIGFMTDIRRMNVGLTRAKSSLWILGDSRALAQGEFWNKLIEDSRRRDRYTSGNIMSMLSRPGAKVPPATFAAPLITARQSNFNSPNPSSPWPSGNSTSREIAESYRGAGIGGLNERGEVMSLPQRGLGPPTIQATWAPTSGKKRNREGGDVSQPNAKKVCEAQPQSREAPIDPSAMEVLGLVPPRQPSPPPPQHHPAVPGTRPPGPPLGAPKGPMIPPKKKAADPFIRRKPNKR